MGEGLLIEFASIVEAVACAIEIQQVTRDQNSQIQDDRSRSQERPPEPLPFLTDCTVLRRLRVGHSQPSTFPFGRTASRGWLGRSEAFLIHHHSLSSCTERAQHASPLAFA